MGIFKKKPKKSRPVIMYNRLEPSFMTDRPTFASTLSMSFAASSVMTFVGGDGDLPLLDLDARKVKDDIVDKVEEEYDPKLPKDREIIF